MMRQSDYTFGRRKPQNGFVKIVSRIFFSLALFSYYYFLQAPLLSLAQHQLSQGQTFYHPLIGAFVLTVVLLFIQKKVQDFLQFDTPLYALSFVPSVLVAVLPTAFTPSVNYIVLGGVLIIFSLWLLLVIRKDKVSGCFFVVTQNKFVTSLYSNVLLFFLCLSFLGILSNNSELLTYEVRVSQLLRDGRIDESLSVGERSSVTSRRLSALRAFAMVNSKTGIGDRLFLYPHTAGGSEDLLLLPEDTLQMLFPLSSYYDMLGDSLQKQEKSLDYFRRCAERDSADSRAKDYFLCALLLDKDLESFVDKLEEYYGISDSLSLPKHYSEALALYNRINPDTSKPYMDNHISEKMNDFMHAYRLGADRYNRNMFLTNSFNGTYWLYYYDMCKEGL